MNPAFFVSVALAGWVSWIGVALAQEAPPEVNLRVERDAAAGQKVRDAVVENWRLPAKLYQDVTARVQATVLLSGALVKPQISLDGLTGDERERTRRSLEEAIGRTVVSLPPGEVEFTILSRASAFEANCFPLKVYVPAAMKDSPEPVPATTVSGLREGALRWNRRLVRQSGGEPIDAFVLVDDPDQAHVRVEAFEDYPEYSNYLVDPQTRRVTVRVPIRELRSGLFASGFRWWHPDVVTLQTMFQLGRLLNLELSEEQGNALFAGTRRFLTYRPPLGVTGNYAARALPQSDHVEAQGRTDRVASDSQIEAAIDTVRKHACTAPAAEQIPDPR
ncbi:TonB C-terminal domain-containing protein [Gloeobacter violaceus]|nr:TonB C-terminal domain-containing protein [Gloeobacter violaceus]